MLLAENDWNDPRNEFPAVLFRLSHRTKKKHRSGYREGDDGDRVAESMRGWWEIAGDDVRDMHDQGALGVKYAVAIHRGQTVAVAQIDGWYWAAGLEGAAHHKLPVDDFLHGSRDRPYEFGSLEDEHWRDHERAGERLRWAFCASPASAKARDVWVGDGNCEISERRRDTLVSIYPYSLADDQRDLVDRAMRALGEVLQEHVTRALRQRDTDWLRSALEESAPGIDLGDNPEDSRDPSLWLTVAISNWAEVQDCFPSFQSGSFFKQLRRLRNRWAHFAYRAQVTEHEIDNLRRMTGLFREIGKSSAANHVDFIRRVLEVHVRRREVDETA